MKPYQRETLARLTEFSTETIRLCKSYKYNYIDKLVISQLVRSCLSPTLMYSEATGAESLDDLIHKMSVALKELRETKSCITILRDITDDHTLAQRWIPLYDECDQLVAIFSKRLHNALEKRSITHKKA
jgi:four helix bundle protein